MTDNLITGIYPGTFDPVTFGHLDIIQRASHIVNKLIISVAENKHKKPYFKIEERINMIKESLNGIDTKSCDIDVVGFDNLLVEHAKKCEAKVIIRGLRAVADFEYEFQLANMNRAMMPELESVFLTPVTEYSFVSSSLVKEICKMGGDVSSFVDPISLEEMKKKFG